MLPTLSSLVEQDVVVMTASGVASDDEADIMITLEFERVMVRIPLSIEITGFSTSLIPNDLFLV